MNQMRVTIDMTGLPEMLAFDLEKQMLAMVEKAKDDLPVSFQDRVARALAELPELDVKDIQPDMLVSSLISQLQAHFNKLGFIEAVSTKASSCINWNEEEFDALEFEHQVQLVLERFFM